MGAADQCAFSCGRRRRGVLENPFCTPTTRWTSALGYRPLKQPRSLSSAVLQMKLAHHHATGLWSTLPALALPLRTRSFRGRLAELASVEREQRAACTCQFVGAASSSSRSASTFGLSLWPLHAKEEAVDRCLDVVCFSKVLQKRAFKCIVLGLVNKFSLYSTLSMETRAANWLVWWLGWVLRLEHRWCWQPFLRSTLKWLAGKRVLQRAFFTAPLKPLK